MLSAPLDTAYAAFQAQSYSSSDTVIPNAGTRTESLILGATNASESQDPPFDSTNGVLQYRRTATPANQSWSHCDVPVSLFNGDFTIGVRAIMRVAVFETKNLATVVDNRDSANPKKQIYIDATTDNRFMLRVWANNVNRSQIIAQSAASVVKKDKTYSVVGRWTAATQLAELFVNGVLVASTAPPAGYTRDGSATNSPLYFGNSYIASNSPNTNFDLVTAAAWDFSLSDSDIASLEVNTDWI